VACLDKITDGNFTVTLTSAETSLLDTKVDFADVCLLRAGLRLAKAGLHLANSYNLSGEYRKLYDLYAAGNLTPQAVLAAFPQLYNLSTTPAQRSDARTQIQLAHAEWNKALAAIKTKRPDSEGSVLGPIGENDSTPFLFAFDSIAAAEEVDKQFDALVASLSNQTTLPASANEEFALEGYNLNLSNFVTSTSSPRSLAPTRFDRGFFRPSTWPDPTLGGIFPSATQDDANDVGNFLFVLQPTVYEPYQFWLLAGTPDEPGYFEDGKVLFNEINGIAVDANGNIYVADQGNHVIRKISIDNKVTTIAGQKWSEWSEREALEEQYSSYPTRYPGILDYGIGPITVDGNGTVYFMNGTLLSKITPDGKLSNLAGSFSWSWQDPKDGLGADAIFDSDNRSGQTMAVDKNGNLYLCDINAIRKITPAGQVTTLAGKLGWDDSEGYVDGAGAVARFNDPTGVAVDDAGVVYVMDSDNFVIRKIQPNGATSTFVGNATISNHFDAKGAKARLNRPEGLAIDSSGNLYFADGSTIRKVKPAGTVTTLAGKLSPERGAFRLRGQMGIQEAAGEAAVFGEEDITGLAVDRRGTLYASFGASIYEAESIAAPPSGTPFPTPTPLPTPVPSFAPPASAIISQNKAEFWFPIEDIDKQWEWGTAPDNHREHALLVELSSDVQIGFTKWKHSSEIPQVGTIEQLLNSGQTNIWKNSSYLDGSIRAYRKGQGVMIELTDSSTLFELNQAKPTALMFEITGKAPFSVSAIYKTPNLNSLKLSTATIDLTNGAADLAVFATKSSPLFNLNFSFENQSPDFNGYGKGWGFGGSFASLYSLRISEDTRPGLWSLVNLEYSTSEFDAQKVTLNEDEILNKYGNISFNVINPLISNDKNSPTLNNIYLLSSEVNVLNSSSNIRYRVQVLDDLSGFDYLNLTFRHADSSEVLHDSLGAWDSLVAVNGDFKTYEGSIEIPQGTTEGDWILDSISVSDKANNRNSVTITSDLRAVKFNVSNTATNPSEPQDQYAPWPVALTLEKASVNITDADQKVKVYLQIANDDIPVQYSISVGFRNKDDEGSFTADNFKLVSGTVGNGIYEGELVIPRYAESGNHTVGSIWIDDYKTDDSKSIDLNPNFFPAELRKTITVTGTQDVTAPVLQSIAFSQTSPDTRNGTVLVTANLTITDDLSGLQEVDYSHAGALALRSPSGKEFLWSEFTWGDRISGSSTNGTYQVQFELPQYSEEGAWTIDYIELVDRNYNTRFLIPANLSTQQLSASTIQVQGWPRTWETFSSNQETANQAKAVITKQSAKFWFPIANIDGNWTWGEGDDDYPEYQWNVEPTGSLNYSLRFSHFKSPGETLQNGNFTAFLNAGQVNVWDETSDSGTTIDGAQITASRDGQCLLIELTDPVYLTKLQKEMPAYLDLSSLGSMQDYWDWQNVKVEYVKEDVQLSLGNLTHTVDGTDKIPTVTTSPGNHTQDVTITYDGMTRPPSEVGSYTVVAYLNTANYKGRQVATMTISKPIQTIAAFSAISDKVFGAAPFVVAAPTSSSGLPVTLIVKSGPATISANNTVTLTGVGAVVLAANQAGNENYSAASEVTTSFTVAKASQTIAAFGAISDKVFGAEPFAITAPASSSSLPVTLSVKSGPATISSNNTLTLTGNGTVLLAANQAGNENYNPAPEVTTQFNVSNPPPPPQAPAPSGGAPSGGGGGGGGEPEKPKKGKKGSDKNDGGDKKSSSKKSDKKDNNDNKSSSKKSEKKSSGGGGDSKKSGGKNSKKK
jgi:sugar lactone lactonase YvrE